MSGKRYLILADGTVAGGTAIGAPLPEGGSTGELVFTTGMTGYTETLTDKSYYGQIIMQTFPMIGNYGVNTADSESGDFTSSAAGYVVREACAHPSNYRSQFGIDEALRRLGVPGIAGVDTRELTRHIRAGGVMGACLSDTATPANPELLASYTVRGGVHALTCKKPYTVPAAGTPRVRAALLDYGAKHSIAAALSARGCEVHILPAATTAAEILSGGYDGLMLSNGPGDPAENSACIRELAALLGRLPVFGICLGHQLLALADGGQTAKLKFGHRGANQPVRECATGRMFITSQNHGYTVTESTTAHGTVSFVNANDGTVEGIEYPSLSAFSVQFHPEAHGGPLDTSGLFDRFITMAEAYHAAR